MDSFLGRALTLVFYAFCLLYLMVTLYRLRGRSTAIAVFIVPLFLMTINYAVLVGLTLEGRPWEIMIPFLQYGQWVILAALVFLFWQTGRHLKGPPGGN